MCNSHNTIIVDAIFPFGHHPEPYPEFNLDVPADTSEMLDLFDENPVVPDSSASSAVTDSSVASPAIPDSTVASSAIPDSSVASSAIPDSSVASSAIPESSVASSVVTDSHKPSSVAHSHDDSQSRGKNHSDSYSLNEIQLRYPQWQTILVRMRMLMRVAISAGECGNPFLLTQATSSDIKARFVNDLFNQTLAQLGISRKDLCRGQ